MKAIVYEGPKTVAMHADYPQPEIRDGYALIRVAYAGICGGDMNIYYGTHPRAKAPLVMGHELSGTLVGGHPTLPAGTPVTMNPLIICGECTPCRTGDQHVCEILKLYGIDCDGAMADYLLVPVERVVPIPEGVDLKTAALIEPIAVAVHTVRDTGYTPGDSCLVFGCGTIGLCTALTLRAFGALDILMVETNPHRITLAREMGFEVISAAESDVLEEVKARTGGSGYDVVLDCAGHQSVADLLPDVVRVRGTIVVVAGYKHPPTLNLIKGMFKEFSIRFVRVYRDKDFRLAGELILRDYDNYKKLITHILAPEQAAEGFDLMTAPGTSAVKVLYDFT